MLDDVNSQPLVFFTKSADFRTLNKVIIYGYWTAINSYFSLLSVTCFLDFIETNRYGDIYTIINWLPTKFQIKVKILVHLETLYSRLK
jgi:hypothetical protein